MPWAHLLRPHTSDKRLRVADVSNPSFSRPTYPAAERLNLVDDYHGTPVADPYRWLEDSSDPRTLEWVAAQGELMKIERESWDTRDHFATRIAELIASGSISPPYVRGDRTFWARRLPDQQFSVVYVTDADGTERVLLDPMTIDPSGLTTLDAWQPSKEGDRLAYQMSVGGNEESELRILDVATGETIDGPIDRCRYSPIAWLPGGDRFYYVRRLAPEGLAESERGFHRRVWLHTVGTPTSEDVLVFGSGMTMTNYYGVAVSRDGRWLEVSSSEGTEPRNNLWLADLSTCSAEAPEFFLVQGDVDAQTGISFGRDGRLFFGTDREAPRGRLAVVDPQAGGQWWSYDRWTDIIAEDESAVLEGWAILDGPELERQLMLVCHTDHTVSRMSLIDAITGDFIKSVPLPGAGTVSGPIEQPTGGPVVWFVYTDHTTVPCVYTYDARTDEVALAASPPGTVEVPEVFSRQVTYVSKDGTEVRMFVISPTAEPDQPRPTILYGYGGFGVPLSPGYSGAILSWVASGGVWAVANIRGGGEEGEEWHRDGMLGKKQNVYDDFHAAAEWLIAQGWTTSSQLGINGGSNGGLLVGAAETQRPDLFNAVVCVAPLLDMIRYVTSELGPTWTVEYGDPSDAEEFAWLNAYSPYHRVTEGTDYPATMFVSFDNDTRTDPMHARKMCAALQHATSGDRPILFRSEGDVGHGARSLNKSVEESADMLAFMARWTGLELAE